MVLSSNSEIVSHCDTIFTEAGATSSCLPPASAVRFATAASSASTTAKFSSDYSSYLADFS